MTKQYQFKGRKMSKLLNTLTKAADIGFQSKQEVKGVIGMINNGAENLAEKELKANMDQASNTLNDSFKRFDLHHKQMMKNEIEMAEKTKLLSQKVKDYTNQVGEAMARIDKVLVKDFETKLDLLERYVLAMQSLNELENKGFLTKVSSVFSAK
jgi:hypothetical protein